jgi:undecaprenyl-diphosphatase
MLDHYFQIIILGFVEGVTEFLPISSTGHLLIAEHLLGTHESDIFNVVIQAGAILAVVFIYWHKILDLFRNIDHPAERNYLINIAIAFVTTTVLVLVVTVKLKLKLPETLTPVAWATFIGGLVIFAVEAFAKHLYPHDKISWFEAILIGAAQVVAAVFPGASRSGSTIMAGMAVGMKRPAVTEFTFLVGIPTMFAASAYDCFKNRDDFKHLGSQLIIDTTLGFFISLVVAFFVVKWLLRFVQSHTFNGFAVYRVVLGGGLLIGLYTHSISDITADETKVPSAPIIIAPSVPSTPAPAPVPPDTSTNSVSPAPLTNAVVTPVVPATAPQSPAVTPTDTGTATDAMPGQTTPVAPRALPVDPSELSNPTNAPTSPADQVPPPDTGSPINGLNKINTDGTQAQTNNVPAH